MGDLKNRGVCLLRIQFRDSPYRWRYAQFQHLRCAAGSLRVVRSHQDREPQGCTVELPDVWRCRGYSWPDQLPQVRQDRTSFPKGRNQVGLEPDHSAPNNKQANLDVNRPHRLPIE